MLVYGIFVILNLLVTMIFLTWGLNPGLRHCWQILYCLSHRGSPVNEEVYMLIYYTFFILIFW